jgi:hypothetical protein
MKGWVILVTGTDAAIGENRRRRIFAVATDDSDVAFAVARATVPGGFPTSVGPLADDAVADLGLKPGEGRVIGDF